MSGKASNESYRDEEIAPKSEQYSEQETIARAEAALKRMLATPPKPHSEMKIGKRLLEDTLSPSLAGDEMQRNMDFKLEALPMGPGGIVDITPDAEEIAVPSYDYNQIDYHLRQIRKAGFIDEGGSRPMAGIGFHCLTPAGHDFLDSVRDPETSGKT